MTWISRFARRPPAVVLPAEFAEAEYLRINPDVAAAIKARVWPSAGFHWFHVGKYEGRRFRDDRELVDEAAKPRLDPDVARLPFDFDEMSYLEAHPDVAAAVARHDFDSGASHWLTDGRAEGRRRWARVDRGELPDGFNERDYLLVNSHVAEMIARDEIESAASYWVIRGQYLDKPPSSSAIYHQEDSRRIFSAHSIADDEQFDEELYLLCNPDVKGAIDHGLYQSGFDHYRP
jgi:hypothetical protein